MSKILIFATLAFFAHALPADEYTSIPNPGSCKKAINVNISPQDHDPGQDADPPTTWGGYYDIQDRPDHTTHPNRRKHFPDAHIQTWEGSEWDCKGNDQGGCNGDSDQWLTLGCDFCVAEEAKAAAGKWAIWHTVNNSNSNCSGFPYKTGLRENCEQDTLPRHGSVKLIATYDERHFWSPKIWTSYSNTSSTAKGEPVCCHPVCTTDPGCDKVQWPCGEILGGCCGGSPLQACHYDGPHDECDNDGPH